MRSIKVLAIGLLMPAILQLGLWAQDTVLGLNFEMEYASARDSLESRGFVAAAGEDYHFVNESGDTEVELCFAKGQTGLKCLRILIQGSDPDELEDTALEMLSQFHSEDFEYDPDMREAWWKLDEFHFLNAALIDEDGLYEIFYGDIREEELNPY